MPLAHTPYRPRPVVEFLGSRPISAEEAARILASSLQGDNGSTAEVRHELPGSTLVNFRQIPGIVDALREDWVGSRVSADCFTEIRGRLETHLHPCFLGEKLALGLRGAAGSLLLRFNRALKCVPLGFTRLLPAGTHGAIVGESPYVHLLADFRAVGFVPKKGQWLVGRVSEQQTMQGLNVLILNCFNMFVSKRILPRELRYDQGLCSWVYGDKPHRLRKQRGLIWVQNNVKSLDSRGPVTSLFGLLYWPPFVVEGKRPPALNEAGRNGVEADGPGFPEEVDPRELQDTPARNERKEKKDKKEKKEKAEKKDARLSSTAASSSNPPPGPASTAGSSANPRRSSNPRPDAAAPAAPAVASTDVQTTDQRGRKRHSTGSIDGPKASSPSGLRKDALMTGTLKRRRSAP